MNKSIYFTGTTADLSQKWIVHFIKSFYDFKNKFPQYISEVNKIAVNIFIANSSNAVVPFLLIMELSQSTMEQQSMKEARNGLFNLSSFESLKQTNSQDWEHTFW